MRILALTCVMAAGCASAGSPGANSGDDTAAAPDAPAALPDAPGPDACADDDGDGRCNAADLCAGHDDALDADGDTIADGCDVCPGADDRADINGNSTPDCTELMTRTIALKQVGGNLWRGWHSSIGTHTSGNENTITGLNDGTTYNSYFVFPLTGFTATAIDSVTLEIELEAYTADVMETFSVWDVTTPAATVEADGSSATIFDDLQSGMTYGTGTATAAQVGTFLSVPLNAQAATDATAKLGADFTLGMHLDTAPGWIRFGHTGSTAPPTVIRLAVRYLP